SLVAALSAVVAACLGAYAASRSNLYVILVHVDERRRALAAPAAGRQCGGPCRSIPRVSVSSPTASTHSPGAERSTPRWRTPLELSVLGAIWGASFLFMRVAADDFGPIPLVEMRLALGALMLSPFLW